MARVRSKTHPAASQPRRDRGELGTTDSYGLPGKLPEPTACNACGAIFRAGRWQWGSQPPDATLTLCPACRRIRDHHPGGILTVRGSFAREHEGEIRHLIANLEERESRTHPLKRVMEIRDEADALVVRTTDARLARALGEALHRAYDGELDYVAQETDPLRVTWSRG